MSKYDKEARIKTLTETQATRKQETLNKVNIAIEGLQKSGTKINFQTVAKSASVSISYLYKYPELKAHITQLRNQQSSMLSSPIIQPEVMSHSKVVENLKKRIHELEASLRELKLKNEALAGQVYRVHSLQEQVERQKQIIETLESRLKSDTQQSTSNKVISLNNKLQAVSDCILNELDEIGIILNENLIKLIKASTESDVLAAIEYYKYSQKRTDIDNPGGWLARAILSRWKKPELQQTPRQELLSKQPSILSSVTLLDREFASPEELANISTIFEDKNND